MSEQDDKGASKAAVIKRADKRYRYALDTDKKNRDEQLYDIRFCYEPGAQWDDETRKNERDGRVCLEINQLPQFVNAVVNDMRQNRAGIRMSPDGGMADEEEARRRQGIVRGIEYDSRADAVYDQGGRDAVVGGRGYWRVVSEYAAPDSFEQKLVIKAIADPLAVLLDPDYQEPDGADRQWGFVCERMTRADFEAQWPDAEPVDWEQAPLGSPWFDGVEHIVVADYYERTAVKRELVMLADGAVHFADEPPPPPPVMGMLPAPEVRRRTVDDWEVRWYKLAGGDQVLESYEWPGKTIPIVCCIGNEIVIEGKRQFWGLVRPARDPQRMYNFAQSTIAETVALTPKSPFMIADGQIEGYEAIYKLANKRNYSYLPYKPTSFDGQLVPPPQRIAPAMVPSGFVQIAETARGDLRSTIGLYDPSLGQRSNETSGRAILAREQQGDNATFNFPDNQSRAIALTGRIINEVMPAYYDTERAARVIEDDGTERTETINTRGPMGIENPIRADSRFTIRVETGPSYATKRQEARESLMAFVQAFPPAAQVAGDLIAKAMDWADADVLSERLEMMLPPHIQQALAQKRQSGPGAAPPDPAMMQQLQQLQGQLEQMGQQMQMLQGENQQLKTAADQKMAAAQMDAQTKQQAAEIDAQAELEKARIDAQTELQKAQLQGEIALKKAEIEAQTKLLIASQQPAQVAAEPGEGGEETVENAQAQMTLATLAAINEALRALSAPKRLIRDEAGRPVGVETVQ